MDTFTKMIGRMADSTLKLEAWQWGVAGLWLVGCGVAHYKWFHPGPACYYWWW